MKPKSHYLITNIWQLLLFIIFIIYLSAHAYNNYCNERNAITNERYEDLKVLTDLKINQIKQ